MRRRTTKEWGIEMILNIVYSTDDNFAYICLTSIVSAIKNKEDEILRFYIIDNGITYEKRIKIEKTVEECENAVIEFIPFTDFKQVVNTELVLAADRYSLSTFCRLFVDGLLPKEVERFIYMDCDTIICQSLKELYQYDLGGNIIGGVDDCKSTKYRWVLGLKDEAEYVNAGVLLIDLKKWRAEECEKKFINYIEEHNGHIHVADQGVINAVLSGNIKLLPLKFNVMTHNYDFTYEELLKFRRPAYEYTEIDIESAKCNPVIIHFTGSFMTRGRGWHTNSNHKKKDVFHEYMKLAGTYEYCKEYQLKNTEKIRENLEKLLPRKIMLQIATIAHEYFEPIKHYWIMRKAEDGSYAKKK